jgi:hypothetical protein
MATNPNDPGVAAAVAAAGALLPLAGPNGVLAATVLAQGMAFWSSYAGRMAAGTLTLADVEAAAAGLNADMATLRANIDKLP